MTGLQREAYTWVMHPRLTNLRLDLAFYGLLVFATAAFSRDFAWLHLRLYSTTPYLELFTRPAQADSFALQIRSGGMPLFATEVFLFLILILLLWRDRTDGSFLSNWKRVDQAITFWLVVGIINLARGLVESPLLALRDFGIVYYALFFYAARETCLSWKEIKRLMAVFMAGTVVRIIIANWYYIFDMNYFPDDGINWPSIGRYMAGFDGAYILLALLVGIAVWRGLPKTKRWVFFVYLSMAIFTITYTQQRSLLLSLVIGIIVVTIGQRRFGATKPLAFHWLLAGGILVGTLLWFVRVGVGPLSPALWLKPPVFLVAKIGGTVQMGGTVRFRRDAWMEAWRRFTGEPILGEGFGKKFIFYDTGQDRWWVKDVRPHNTYLTILYKTGVFGLAVFILIHLVFYRNVYRALSGDMEQTIKTYVLGFTSAFIAFQVYGFFNLLLESPFLALVYWSLMGIIVSLIRPGYEVEVTSIGSMQVVQS